MYVKQHKKTKLKYFGKTISDPCQYNGSGKYWLNHLKIHGKDIENLFLWKFTDQEECSRFALNFSAKNNIVESVEWANLIFEDGINHPPNNKGKPISIETRKKISDKNKGKKRSEEFCKLISEIKIGSKVKPSSVEKKQHISIARIGKKWYTNDDRSLSICCFPGNEPDGWHRGQKIRKSPEPGLKRNKKSYR